MDRLIRFGQRLEDAGVSRVGEPAWTWAQTPPQLVQKGAVDGLVLASWNTLRQGDEQVGTIRLLCSAVEQAATVSPAGPLDLTAIVERARLWPRPEWDKNRGGGVLSPRGALFVAQAAQICGAWGLAQRVGLPWPAGKGARCPWPIAGSTADWGELADLAYLLRRDVAVWGEP